MAPQIRLEGITVRFGALTALADACLTLNPGERHAVVGENGAGKSTLMKVLFGLVQPDEGKVLVEGRPVRFTSPRGAIAAGIGMVHQHFDLIGAFTVWENVVLGAEPRSSLGGLDRGGARERVAALAERSGLALDVDARVAGLSVAAQQRTEILKALWRNARVLILDEPTAVLSPPEARELFAIVERLAGEGRSIAFITHKLGEVMAHADRVSVLRRGESVLSGVPTVETDPEALAAAMVGETSAPVTAPPRSIAPFPLTVSVRGLTVLGARGEERVKGVSLELRGGEILGLAGIDGSGQLELLEALVGLRAAMGTATMAGQNLLGLSIAQRRAMGVAYLPDDRLRLALAPGATISETAVLGRHRERAFAGKLGWVRRRARDAFAAERIAAFDVRGTEPNLAVGALSGGNQQKLVLARELSRQPTLLLAAQPTRGLDFAATAFVHDALRAERDRGAAVVIASLDLFEMLALSERIAVFFAGKLVGVVPASEASEEVLGRMMTGASGA
jgi:simple sugar transport system ATP-binding protein